MPETARSLLLKALGILLALTTAAAAQQYPTRPVRLIVPAAPGAINDTVGRMIATSSRTGWAGNSWSTTAPARAP